MRADTHDGPEHMLQSEAGYIDARPLTPARQNLLQRTAGPYIRVNHVVLAARLSFPVFPNEQTFSGAIGMSQTGQARNSSRCGPASPRVADARGGVGRGLRRAITGPGDIKRAVRVLRHRLCKRGRASKRRQVESVRPAISGIVEYVASAQDRNIRRSTAMKGGSFGSCCSIRLGRVVRFGDP